MSKKYKQSKGPLSSLQNAAVGYVGTGMLLGVGTKVVGAAGSPASASAIAGMGNWMSPMATISGAGATMGSLKMLQPKGKKHKFKY